MNSSERVAARLRGDPVDRLPAQPLFMIYVADLLGVSYADYVRDHRTLVRGQLALAERFPIDVVSCCSDAWREAADCGARLVYRDRQPPSSPHPLLRAPEDLARLPMPDPATGLRMTDRLKAIQLLAAAVRGEVPILGWVEGPLASAVNLYGMNEFLLATRRQLAFARDLLDWTAALAIRFARAQAAAGADMIGVGDAAASLISPHFYRAEVAPRERQIVRAIHDSGAVARLHICGDIRGKFADLAATGADLIDVDANQTIAEVRSAVGANVCLAGNLHPVHRILNSSPNQILADLAECHRQAGMRYILAAGCEIPPGTPDENAAALFAYARSTC
jgi:MtaA/CmuA family methyltransferase